MHLRQPRFLYSTYRPFIKNTERIQTFKETVDSRYIYQNEINKDCFQHHMANGDFKNLPRKTTSEVLRDKAFTIAKNWKYDGYQKGLASMVCKFFDKNSWGDGIKSENMLDQQSVEEVYKPIIKKLENHK